MYYVLLGTIKFIEMEMEWSWMKLASAAKK